VCQSYEQLLCARIINGVGVGVVSPLLYSLVADLTVERDRGKAFGVLCLMQSLGGTIGSAVSTVLAGHRRIDVAGWSIAGWRLSLFGLCVLGVVLSAGLFGLGEDPRQFKASATGVQRPTFAEACAIFRMPTFRVIVAQGCFGNIPWAAWNFATMWLELNCFDNTITAAIVATYSVGQVVGQPLGGYIGDWADRKSRDHGRPLVAVASVAMGIPCVFVFYKLLPVGQGADTLPAIPYIGTALLFGLVMSWTLSGVNAPIYSEIVPPAHRTLVFGMDAAVEGSVGALGAPIAGWMALHMFHYDTAQDGSLGSDSCQDGSLSVSDGSDSQQCDVANANALGQAIMWTMMLPWCVCCLIYCLLLRTYKHDRLPQMGTEAPLLQ
jgi:MFS family permease